MGFWAFSTPPTFRKRPQPSLQPTAGSKIFTASAWHLHTTLLDSRDDVHFLFKSSPFGTQSHGHNPHNTFQLNAYGEELLSTCVYRDLHGSKFHYQWAHSTVAHNGMLVNGEGQIKHTPAPHGRIAAEQLAADYDYVMGDATAAYGDRLTRYHRHVLFLKNPEPLVLILDDVAATQPATFQFMLHGYSQFNIDESAARLQVQRPKAGLTALYLSAVPLTFRQWDGFEPNGSRVPEPVARRDGHKRQVAGNCDADDLQPYRGAATAPALKLERVESPSASACGWVREREPG